MTTLLLPIFAELGVSDRVRLSSACRRLRHLGVHQARVFETLSVTWARQSVADSALLVAQKYSHTVKTLRVIQDPPEYCPDKN